MSVLIGITAPPVVVFAVDFESASALIATQAQDLKLSAEDISAMTKELARAQPVQIPGLQQSLFDIFSYRKTIFYYCNMFCFLY